MARRATDRAWNGYRRFQLAELLALVGGFFSVKYGSLESLGICAIVLGVGDLGRRAMGRAMVNRHQQTKMEEFARDTFTHPTSRTARVMRRFGA